eukprot:CAMPEP_0174837052 /NCGR_PEP_ID=MMETSP1114-20130205/6484_1 /TAXON_ID=312471 /ORGANISM="Neobodo designis, Strain CCAP 1951/1" /LENGTH=202 /DNA_ID=CAMNT_0016071087 /DNA_START=376 /DNA_END=985 /DNA_ORIENTATION=-
MRNPSAEWITVHDEMAPGGMGVVNGSDEISGTRTRMAAVRAEPNGRKKKAKCRKTHSLRFETSHAGTRVDVLPKSASAPPRIQADGAGGVKGVAGAGSLEPRRRAAVTCAPAASRHAASSVGRDVERRRLSGRPGATGTPHGMVMRKRERLRSEAPRRGAIGGGALAAIPRAAGLGVCAPPGRSVRSGLCSSNDRLSSWVFV